MPRWFSSALRPELLFLLALALPAGAAEFVPGNQPLFPPSSALTRDGTTVLPVDEAFVLSAFLEADGNLILMWEIQPGHYLYRDSLALAETQGTALSSLDLPQAEAHSDEFFGATNIYRERLLLRVPLARFTAQQGATLDLLVSYQGCAEDLYCYPPVERNVRIALPE